MSSSTSGYIKKLQNEISSYESASNHKIPLDSYYVVLLTMTTSSDTSTQLSAEALSSIAEEVLGIVENSPYPILTYIYPPCIYYLYSSVDEKKNHLYEGSHQKLCSEFSSVASIVTGTLVSTEVVELETKSQVIAYFCLKNFENVRHSLVFLSKERVTKKDVAQYTLGECIDLFDKKVDDVKGAKKKWASIPPSLRYGIFIKGRGAAKKTSSIPLDFKEMDVLSSLLF